MASNSSLRTKPAILVLMGCFSPGADASGPNQSLRAMCEALGDDFDFRIAARDRAFGSRESQSPGPGWRPVAGARAQYLRIGPLGARGLAGLLNETPHDLLMLNGFFDREFTLPALTLRLGGVVTRRPVLLSPRGEFSAGALSLKAGVKRAWLTAALACGLLKGVTLHATGEEEAADIDRVLAGRLPTVTAPNARFLFQRPPARSRAPGAPLRLAFLGRISRIKNLDFALKVLARVKAPVIYDVYGPDSDPAYAKACQNLAATLPPHVVVRFHGEVSNAEAPRLLAAHDLLFLPTLGENFGHAIFESLASGVPVLISDRTPWRSLEARHAGIDLPLERPDLFAQVIERFAVMAPADFIPWRDGARLEAELETVRSDAARQLREMLLRACER